MKKNTGVNVKVDYYNGTYTVTGIYNNKILSVRRPITGVDKDGYFKKNFSWKLILERRYQMKKNLKKIHEECPEFKFSKKLIKNVDPLMYKSLKSWDKMAETTYASDYLKAMVQVFDESSFSKTSQGTYEEKCVNARKKDLKRHGIRMSYDVALINASKTLSLLDRIRGIKIAKKQEKLASVEVKKSIFMKKRKVSLDIEALRKAKVKTAQKQLETTKKLGLWKRKVNGREDSIRNKKFIPNKEGDKKFGIKNVVTLLAAGSILFNVSLINHLKPSYDIPITEQTTDSDKNYNRIDGDSELDTNLAFFDNGELDSQDDNNKSNKKIQEITFEVEDDKVLEKNSNNEITFEVENIKESKDSSNKGISFKGITFEVEDDKEVKESSNEENTTEDVVVEKSDEEKLEEFKQMATQKYMDAFVIGEKPNVGNMLDNQYYSENMNGSGTIGFFSTHPDSITGRIFVVKEDGEKEIIDAKGMTLSEVLDAFPKYKDYYIQFAGPSESGSLKPSDYRGYINRTKLERLIKSQVDSIIESKTSQNLELSSDDEAR